MVAVLTQETRIMVKAVSDFLFGLCFGCGFFIAKAVLDLVASLLSHHS